MAIESADQPVFTLGIDAGSCRFEVRLNDVPILTSDAALPMDVAFPVSEYIVRGPNRIAALVSPPPVYDDEGDELPEQERFDPAESALRLTLWVKRNGAPLSERQAITTLNFVARDVAPDADPPQSGVQSSSAAGRFDSRRSFVRDDEAGNVMISDVTIERNEEPPHEAFMFRDVGMRSPFPTWKWLRAQTFTDDDETHAELLAEYQRVWGLLKAQDVAGVEQLQQVKAAEYQAAYYLDAAGLREGLPLVDLMQSEDLTLQPLETDELELRIFGDGRLAKLVDEDENSPIVFVSSEDVGYWMELTYCRTDEGLVLVR